MSISFDRAAQYYDSTRGLPAPYAGHLADALAAELDGRGRTLEIGVGTGRIALPVHACGIPLVGIDLSLPMLRKLVENAGGSAPFPLSVADATRLPFDSGAFGAVMASHVFHLISEWRAALEEAIRVVRPGGALLVQFVDGVIPPWQQPLLDALRRHGITRDSPGVTDPEECAAALGTRANMRPLAVIEMPVRRSLADDLRDLEGQIASWLWNHPVEQIRAACDEVREWAAGENLDVSEPVDLVYPMRWWAYDLN